MLDYYLTVLKKYAVFEGRARRSEYWYFVLVNFLISMGTTIVDFSIGFSEVGILNPLYSLAVLVPSIAVGVRRMHDVGKSGWFLLIPIYNLILAIREGDIGENRYGQDPKNPLSDISDHLVP